MAKHTNLLWASTGAGKSSLLMSFAKGLWEEKRKKTRLVSAEKAQSEGIFREGIEGGYILPWWLDDRRTAQGDVETPFERMTDAMLGKWPEDAENPFSKLIPAFDIRYVAICRDSEKHKGAGVTPVNEKGWVTVYSSDKAPTNAQAAKCPKCQASLIVETQRVVSDKRLAEVGAYFFEGLTEFGAMMMANLSLRAARGESTGGDIPVRFKDGQMDIGSPTRGHYGTSQLQLKNRVGESKHLPVDYVWWTAGREDGTDQDRRVMVFGPKLPGSAATADVPRWFGTTLSVCVAPIEKANPSKGVEHRLYLKPYYCDWIDAIKNIENLVDNRIPPERLKGIPQFVKVDHEQEWLEVAGRKMRPGTLLWDVTQLIEQRQNPQQSAQPITPPPK